MTRKIKVGMKVYVCSTGYKRGLDRSPKEAEVIKVGRKYFTVRGIDDYFEAKFYLSDLRHSSGQYNPTKEIFLSWQDYQDKIDREDITGRLRTVFRDCTIKLSFDQLKRINAILDEKELEK